MAINATFGVIDYRENAVISVPIDFRESVIVPSKTVFEVTHVSGDALVGISYVLLGKDTAYELVFSVPLNRSGSFRISANGDVLKIATGEFESVTVAPVVVSYSTTEPMIVDFDVPAGYDLGSPVDIFVAYNVIVTGWKCQQHDNRGGGYI